MKDLNSILSDVAKANMASDYWLNFDLREKEECPLPKRTMIAKELYPECSDTTIELKNTTYKAIESTLTKRLSQSKEAQTILRSIIHKTSETGNEYYQLNAPEDCHPTPAIFWNFWYLIINRSKNIAIGLSCSACD